MHILHSRSKLVDSNVTDVASRAHRGGQIGQSRHPGRPEYSILSTPRSPVSLRAPRITALSEDSPQRISISTVGTVWLSILG